MDKLRPTHWHSAISAHPFDHITVLGGGGPMAEVSSTGLVRIDWPRVEAVAADRSANNYSWAHARLLIAARDGTTEPFDPDD